MLYVGPRSALTSHTAAALYGCTAADTGTIHVLSGYDRKVLPRPGFMLHQGFYEEPDVLKLDGLRAIALEIALAELLCTAPRPLALACADQALAGFDARLQATLRDEIAKRLQSRIDPRGTRRAEVLLGLASGLPESPAESAMLLALHDARLPMPVLQFRVLDLAGREVCHPRHPLRPLARIRLSHPRHPAPSAVNATLTAPTAASVAFTAFARRRHVA